MNGVSVMIGDVKLGTLTSFKAAPRDLPPIREIAVEPAAYFVPGRQVYDVSVTQLLFWPDERVTASYRPPTSKRRRKKKAR